MARVVQVPEEDERSTDISTLFTRILDDVYDPLEPFRPLETDRDAPMRAEIGSFQNSTDFQGIPVMVFIVDAVSFFGLYIKLYILHENKEATSSHAIQWRRNAFEVSLCLFGLFCYCKIEKLLCVAHSTEATSRYPTFISCRTL